MRRLIRILPVGFLSVIAVGVIAYLSLASDPLGSHVRLFPHSDKVAHCLMYLAATVIFIFDYAKYKAPHHTRLNVEIALMAAAMLLGLIMEVLQLALHNGRSYDTTDIAVNCIGALLGLALMKWKGQHVTRNILVRHRHSHHSHHNHHSHHRKQL